MCTGALRTTPTSALQIEMGEMPLELRREQLALSYWVNLKGHSEDHPTKDTLKPSWEKERRETKSFGWKKAKEHDITAVNISPTVPLSVTQP